ncbi:recombinase family protein [Nocardia neocaledoniensis]|uniref:recombinase family protein n=1 Tax=Nocardia neocaledoniensis TaxID=236511 RepID=UPI002454ECBD|nr:recombinase family protein [Nocardia neocaledoniensis]
MRLTGYVRVSTIEQTNGYGPDSQRAAIRKAARKLGAVLDRAWCEDLGLSGTLDETERPGLACALAKIKAGEADGILVKDLDRIARAVTVQEAFLAAVWAHGGRVYLANGEEVPRDDPDDPMRTAMRQMMAVFSELERRTIVKRLRDGRNAKRAAGGHADGAPGYGWITADRSDDNPHGALVAEPSERAAVTRMLELHAEGRSLRQIVSVLTEEGVPTKRGGRWQANTVRRILDREASVRTASS